MTDFNQRLCSLPDFLPGSGAPDEQIVQAEQQLGVHFADDYREYLKMFGTACANGHELTGLCTAKRLNVTDITMEERAYRPDIPKSWYVLEQTNIDDIVIWQNATGEVYQTRPGVSSIRLGDSMLDFLIKY